MNRSLNVLVAALSIAALAGCGGATQDSSTSLNPESKDLVHSVKAVGTVPADYQAVTQALYVAYFGRPADPAGEANYEAALLAAEAPTDVFGLSSAYATNPKIQALIDSFGKSTESQALYGTGTTTQFVTTIYANLLSRQPQQAGLSFWSDAISNGTLTQGDAALSIMAGALGNTSSQGQLDGQLVQNRLVVAQMFTDTVTAKSAVNAYTGAGAAANARAMLASVTASTVTSAYQTQVTNSVQYAIETQAAIDTINAMRASVGMPPLIKVGSLAVAAQNHATYMADNMTAGLVETAGLPGYTAADTSTRLLNTGYGSMNGNDEDAYETAPTAGSIVGVGVQQGRIWVDAPVLRNAFLWTGGSDIGVGLALNASGTLEFGDVLLGWKTASETESTYPASFVAYYPAPGATEVPLHAGLDASAFPSYSLSDFATKTGYPISVSVGQGVAIQAGSLTVTANGSTSALPMTVFSAANNSELNSTYMAFVGTAPFAPNTTYNVVFTGTTSNGPLTKSWSFTTGNGN